MISVSARLLQNNAEISRIILENIRDYLSGIVSDVQPSVSSRIFFLLTRVLKEEPEYQSLKNGKLRAGFGLPDTDSVDQVVNSLANSIEIENKPLTINRGGITGGFKFNIIKSDDLSGVIDFYFANITTDKGFVIPWLRWLTLSGNDLLVLDYDIKFGAFPNSRSGMAVMQPSSGASWRVPPEFVGTIDNNWITRAISRIENDIYDIMIQSIQDRL